jgi:hypothetical protein
MTDLPKSAETVEAYKAARRDEALAWMRWKHAEKTAELLNTTRELEWLDAFLADPTTENIRKAQLIFGYDK